MRQVTRDALVILRLIVVVVLFSGIPWAPAGAKAIPISVSRDPAAWPFDAQSPWNYPIGLGAIFAPTVLPISGGRANIETYSTPVYVAKPTDPLVKIYDRRPFYGDAWPPEEGAVTGNLVGEIRIPLSAPPAWGSDGVMVVVDPEKAIAYEFYRVAFISPTGHHLSWKNNNWGYRSDKLSAAKAISVDLKDMGLVGRLMSDPTKSAGVSAYGGSLTGGVIRRSELKNGIPHAIRIAAQGDFLNRDTPAYRRYGSWSGIWPARASDRPQGYTGVTNNVYMGSLLAVPGWVSEDSLGLKTLEGRMVFRALQNYGGYITDKTLGKATGRLVTQVDPQARTDIPDVAAFNADLRRIFRALQVVTNSHDKGAKPPWGPGGGGTPRVSLAASFPQDGHR